MRREDDDDRLLIFIRDREKIHEAVSLRPTRTESENTTKKREGRRVVRRRGRVVPPPK